MSAPLMPSPLDYVGRRRFCFYPPIALPDPNEWLLGIGGRAEVQAVNAQTGREIWVSRQFIGAVSETDSPLLTVGLTQRLQLSEGAVRPRVKQVIEMPVPDREEVRRGRKCQSGPASVVAIRLASRLDQRRVLRTACTGAIVLALVAALAAATIHF